MYRKAHEDIMDLHITTLQAGHAKRVGLSQQKQITSDDGILDSEFCTRSVQSIQAQRASHKDEKIMRSTKMYWSPVHIA